MPIGNPDVADLQDFDRLDKKEMPLRGRKEEQHSGHWPSNLVKKLNTKQTQNSRSSNWEQKASRSGVYGPISNQYPHCAPYSKTDILHNSFLNHIFEILYSQWLDKTGLSGLKLSDIEEKFGLHKLHHKTNLTRQIFSSITSVSRRGYFDTLCL